ncbi:hypothetical protein GLIP_4247 [Aliiglaciecola lipolytica E3]|uniref:Uncharacterized protein n=1 Tax=Aliiglaciecola lipolytica E3 TaxID=1127673 RepID=K6YJT7_9ALTE|nr:hypothetical protein GLIP_4247 [Aliiglaciecola lipolytica E3]
MFFISFMALQSRAWFSLACSLGSCAAAFIDIPINANVSTDNILWLFIINTQVYCLCLL